MGSKPRGARIEELVQSAPVVDVIKEKPKEMAKTSTDKKPTKDEKKGSNPKVCKIESFLTFSLFHQLKSDLKLKGPNPLKNLVLQGSNESGNKILLHWWLPRKRKKKERR